MNRSLYSAIKIIISIVTACCIAILFGYIAMICSDTWTIVPTKSKQHELTLVLYKRFQNNKPVITLSQYINNTRICDYVLEIVNGIQTQETQTYELPRLSNGRVDVNVELGDELSSSFTLTYNKASDLYKDGLLVYLTDNNSNYSIVDGEEFYDRYIYFVSGAENVCYFKDAVSLEWLPIINAPMLKHFKRNELQPYIVIYSGWKENEWMLLPKLEEK